MSFRIQGGATTFGILKPMSNPHRSVGRSPTRTPSGCQAHCGVNPISLSRDEDMSLNLFHVLVFPRRFREEQHGPSCLLVRTLRVGTSLPQYRKQQRWEQADGRGLLVHAARAARPGRDADQTGFGATEELKSVVAMGAAGGRPSDASFATPRSARRSRL